VPRKHPPITPPPPACTVVTRHDGSIFSFCLRQILTLPSERLSRNRDSSDQATFFQSSTVNFGELLLPLFPIYRGDEWYPVGSCSVVAHPPQGCVLWLHKCFAAYLDCNEWLFQSKLLFYQLEAFGPFSSDL